MTDGQVADAGNTGKDAAAAAAATNAGQTDDKSGAAANGNGAASAGNGDASKTIAQGAESKDAGDKPYWPADWREKAAEHYAAGDAKAKARELKRLQGITDPAGLFGMYRELESKWTSGGLIKKPGKDATPEDIAEYHKSLGVPEKVDDYFKDLKLDNGAVLGDMDLPVAKSFAEAAHKAGVPPAGVHAALNWYFNNQESQAAALDEADDTFRREAEAELKEEFGPALKRKTNAIATLFSQAPGGTDLQNNASLYARLMGGRTADGKIIGNDPAIVKWLVGMVQEVNPAMSVVEDGDVSGKGVEAEIAEIEKIMRVDRRRYDKELAPRYTQLLEARERMQARK